MRATLLKHLGKLWPGSCQTEHTWNPCREVGEAVSQVLDERVAPGKTVGGGRLLEPTHRIQPLLEMPMIAFQAGVEILRGPVLGVG